jgi:hypothetical protein
MGNLIQPQIPPNARRDREFSSRHGHFILVILQTLPWFENDIGVGDILCRANTKRSTLSHERSEAHSISLRA